jgi:hypothetical protein
MKNPKSNRFMHEQRIGGARSYRLLMLMLAVAATACSQCSHASKDEPGRGNVGQSHTSPGAQSPVHEILAFNSAECVTCANAHCQAKINRCLNIEGNATDGPSKGRPRSQLCADTLSCAIKGRCPNDQTPMPCYCGSAKGLDCIGPKADGSCKAKLESGLETTDPKTIATDFIKDKTGGGAAMSLVLCLLDNSCTICF